jgi:hypothetical protein
VTTDEYRVALKALGLSSGQTTSATGAIYEDADGNLSHVVDPEQLTPDERRAFIELLTARMRLSR